MKNYIIYKFLIASVLCFCFFGNSFAQTVQPNIFKEINTAFDSLKTIKNDSVKLAFNNLIYNKLNELLQSPASFDISSDSLKRVGVVKAPDNKFRIFTWNVYLSDGTNRFFGIIQMAPAKNGNCKLFQLNDISFSLKDKDRFATFYAPQWFGALYYQIIKNKVKKVEVYTLLAARFNDLFTNQKIVESLYFDENGNPVFGDPVFENGLNLERRLIYEYSINAVMSLKYYEDMKMIVFDHLSPSSPIYTGVSKFYGPDFSYDGYKFEKDKWIYIPNIDFKKQEK